MIIAHAHNPKYHSNVIGDCFYIKKGTIFAWIGNEVYCRDCIDQVYQRIRLKLDSKLWAFH